MLRQYSFQDVQQLNQPSKIKRVHSMTDNVDDDVFIIKIQSVYQLIFTHNVIKSIEIVSTVKEKDHFSIHKKHIVHYVIDIKTDYFDYQIERRYKQFLQLYNQIKERISFPEFPQKKIFKSNKSEVILERKQLLSGILPSDVDFLQCILKKLTTIKSVEFLKFIEIKESFLKRGFANIKLCGLSNDDLEQLLDRDMNKYMPQNEVEKAVICYIEKLNNRKLDRVKIIHQLENYLFGKFQNMSYHMIQYLLIGDQENEGLLHMVSEAHIQCNPILNFIRNVLEFEYNPFAEISLKVFSELNMKQIKFMKLQHHINSQTKCQQTALILLYKYQEGNPMLGEKFIKFLLEDQQAYEIYNTFKQTKQNRESAKSLDGSEEMITPATTQETVRKFSSKEMIFLEDDNTAEFLKKLLGLNYEWKTVKSYRNCRLSHLQGLIVRTEYYLPISNLDTVYRLFTESKSWRSSFKKFKIIETIDENNFIALESFIWSIKSVYETFVFISKFSISRSDTLIEFSVQFLKDYSKEQLEHIKKSEILCNKVSYVQIEKRDGIIQVTTMTNLIDEEQRNHCLPQLLNEDNSFEAQIDKLYQLL